QPGGGTFAAGDSGRWHKGAAAAIDAPPDGWRDRTVVGGGGRNLVWACGKKRTGRPAKGGSSHHLPRPTRMPQLLSRRRSCDVQLVPGRWLWRVYQTNRHGAAATLGRRCTLPCLVPGRPLRGLSPPVVCR